MWVPQRIPGYRYLLIVLAVYGAAWIALEGHLLRVTLLAVLSMLALLAAAIQRWFGGRVLSLPGWLALCGTAGFLFGAGSPLLTLVLMAVKTGLHAHGPEFTLTEILLVLNRIPLWAAVGLPGGLGLGLLLAGLGHDAPIVTGQDEPHGHE